MGKTSSPPPVTQTTDRLSEETANIARQLFSETTPIRTGVAGQFTDVIGGGGFDPEAYLARYPDVATDPFFARNPYEHYVRHGRGEGREFVTSPGSGQGVRELSDVTSTIVPVIENTRDLLTVNPDNPALYGGAKAILEGQFNQARDLATEYLPTGGSLNQGLIDLIEGRAFGLSQAMSDIAANDAAAQERGLDRAIGFAGGQLDINQRNIDRALQLASGGTAGALNGFSVGGNLAATSAGIQAGMWNSAANRDAAAKQGLGQGVGKVGSTLAAPYVGVPGQKAGTCWVAREIYGDDSPRWVLFRSWLLSSAPLWLRRLYIRRGEWFAGKIRGRPIIKSIIRRAMDCVVGGVAMGAQFLAGIAQGIGQAGEQRQKNELLEMQKQMIKLNAKQAQLAVDAEAKRQAVLGSLNNDPGAIPGLPDILRSQLPTPHQNAGGVPRTADEKLSNLSIADRAAIGLPLEREKGIGEILAEIQQSGALGGQSEGMGGFGVQDIVVGGDGNASIKLGDMTTAGLEQGLLRLETAGQTLENHQKRLDILKFEQDMIKTAEQESEQKQGAIDAYTKQIAQTGEIETILNELEGTLGTPGYAEEGQDAALKLKSVFGDEKAVKLLESRDRFRDIAVKFGVDTIFELVKLGLGTVSQQKFKALLDNAMSLKKQPGANRKWLADFLAEIQASSKRDGIDVPGLDELSAMEERLRSGDDGWGIVR